MSNLKLATLFAFAASAAYVAFGQPGSKRTEVTFSAPVEIPGEKVLPAGTYTFKLLDSTGNRNIVQIFNKDETQLVATILGITDYRDTIPTKTIIGFDERPGNSPDAISEWFYPGDQYGVAFVYPHDEAAKIAKRTGQKVLSMRNEMGQNISAPVKSASDSSARSMQNAEVTAVSQTGESIDSSQVVKTKPKQ